ncbi:hypothetical protein A2W39_01895 [Candidatus Azambacteria bacterium RIFCSPHIGHO2_01_46_10]|uniref:Uncharacterized protein n=1 Tax=Candidatus Azambacteria bacterium RIFCSPHIGHO2_01_46_10 TaxID=1797293 RepID=A0A1F5BZU7_9BACT|nr:MAG: hypothetical protein A2W39_01895 [Candidatus Azambacteria bacterium RIFCSPHIGHO2_01_46_10]
MINILYFKRMPRSRPCKEFWRPKNPGRARDIKNYTIFAAEIQTFFPTPAKLQDLFYFSLHLCHT